MPVIQHMGEKSSILSAAADLLQAIEAKDENAMAAAFKKAFKACESEPHDEAPSESEQE